MGKSWDKHPKYEEWGEAIMPLLYPGALVLMFGGTKTSHKLATGMEAAGYELLDTIMWLYGSGFPKAYNVAAGIEGKLRTGSAGWNGWGDLGGAPYERQTGYTKLQADQGYRNDYSDNQTSRVELIFPASQAFDGYKSPALKPAWEPILVFRAPRQGKNYVDLALEHGSGLYNIDGARIPTSDKKQNSRAFTNGMFGDPNKTDASGGVPPARKENVDKLKPRRLMKLNCGKDGEPTSELECPEHQLALEKLKDSFGVPDDPVGAPVIFQYFFVDESQDPDDGFDVVRPTVGITVDHFQVFVQWRPG